jgi:RNA polymerase-binding transcription factor DksA
VQERLEYDVSEIDAALERIESGDYGRCETCGKTISDERLEILPATRYCLEHAPRQVGPGSESANQVTQELDQV